MRIRSTHTVLAGALIALILTGCSGGQDRTPAPGGTLDIIAFGARDIQNDERSGLYTARPDGSDLKLVSREEGFIFFPRWSPDGNRIAYIVGTEGQTAPGVLKVYDVNGSTSSSISSAAVPSQEGPAVSWSPDSQSLAFSEGSPPQLRVYSLEAASLVPSEDVSALAPDWSAGGDIAIIHSDGAGETGIYAVQPDGSGLDQLFSRPGVENGVRWSPDGGLLAFWTAAPEGDPLGHLLATLDPVSGEIMALGSGLQPAWSPDGVWLAYAGRSPGDPIDVDVLLIASEGGEPLTLNEAGSRDGAPSWGPQSDVLVYQAFVNGNTAFLCLAKLEPPERDCLDLPGLVPGAPAWSPR